MGDSLATTKQCIIIGGGYSIKEGVEKGLWSKIANLYTIGINYSYKYFPNPTLQTYVDRDFYTDHKEELSKLPLIIGKQYRMATSPNTIMIRSATTYKRNLSSGIYKAHLAGLYTLSLAIYLLDEGEIYLLGYDFGERRTKEYTTFAKNPRHLRSLAPMDKDGHYYTHFYQGDINHRGIGKISHYNDKGRAKKDFAPYEAETKVKVYNVSMISKIVAFPKMSYDEFFGRIHLAESCNQARLREDIRARVSHFK